MVCMTASSMACCIRLLLHPWFLAPLTHWLACCWVKRCLTEFQSFANTWCVAMGISELEQLSKPSLKWLRRFIQGKLSFTVRPTVDCLETLTNLNSSTGVSRHSATSQHANRCKSMPWFNQLTCTHIRLAAGNCSLIYSEKLALLELQ